MTFNIHKIPIFQKLENSKNVLLAGAGGGFDIYAGIPLYLNLVNQGKNVIIGNFSFTFLPHTTSEEVFPNCYHIKSSDEDLSKMAYFPEKYLKEWLEKEGYDARIYAFQRSGVKGLREAYLYLMDKHNIDTILLIDGGTDSLMFGDEEGLGTPVEDVISMSAVYQTNIEHQYLLNLGFGIDHFHGVSHFRYLENVAELSKEGGYLGAFQLIKEMEEAQKYREALYYANQKMPDRKSIVSNSIVSALEGEYGDYHKTNRTQGSELWINPLMTMYWCFDLKAVVRKIKYYDYIKSTNSVHEFMMGLQTYRLQLGNIHRTDKQLPI